MNAMGLLSISPKIPKGLHPKLAEVSVGMALGAAWRWGWVVVASGEVESSNRNVRYVGIRIKKL
jgi:hypothetical protein